MVGFGLRRGRCAPVWCWWWWYCLCSRRAQGVNMDQCWEDFVMFGTRSSCRKTIRSLDGLAVCRRQSFAKGDRKRQSVVWSLSTVVCGGRGVKVPPAVSELYLEKTRLSTRLLRCGGCHQKGRLAHRPSSDVRYIGPTSPVLQRDAGVPTASYLTLSVRRRLQIDLIHESYHSKFSEQTSICYRSFLRERNLKSGQLLLLVRSRTGFWSLR